MSTTDTETLKAQAKLLSDLIFSTGEDSGPAYDQYVDIAQELADRGEFGW